MAITKEYATGTIVLITARATISSGDPELLEYTWFRNGERLSTSLSSGIVSLLTSTAGTYYVVVSHPNADSVTSDEFIITNRAPRDILRLIYHASGTNVNSDGSFTNPVAIDWNIATQQYEFGPDAGNGFGTPSSGWWRVFAKEKDVSLDITLRGSSGAGSNPGRGGVSEIRRTFEFNQTYTFRVGDDNDTSITNPDVALNGPNGGRVNSGRGSIGGGVTYIKRGGTLLAVCGGGGGTSANGNRGGDGGGVNVEGSAGEGISGGSRTLVVAPGDFISSSATNYATGSGTRTMTRCGLASPNSASLSCTVELTADDLQNNGAWAFNGGGAGGSGVTGGLAGGDSNGGGAGGSGWASSAVTVLSASIGGNPQKKRGSVRIRKTGFNNYIVSWYHTTGVQVGLTPVFNVTNTGNFTATLIPQNEGTTATGNFNQLTAKHYLVKFQESFLSTNYTIEFTFISTTIAGVQNTILPNMKVSQITKETDQFRVWFTGDDVGNVHVREVAFKVY